jgi:Protein  of unknown function (DUF3018)
MQLNVAQRVQKHRIHLRASGLRPVQIWVPDVRQPTFAQECLRQTRLAAVNDASDSTLDDWMNAAVIDIDGWAA